MSNENAKIDSNFKPTATAVTDNAAQEIRNLRIDDTTKGLKVMIVGGVGTGTVTSISQGTGILATPNPIIATGSIALSTPLQPLASLTGNSLKVLRVNAGETAVEYATAGSSGITVGTTTITSGTTTRILYDNAGVVGEYTLTGTGTVVAMQTSPTFNTSITVAGVVIDATDINVSTNNLLMISTNNTNRWQFSATGHFLAATDNTYDIGANGATRPRTLYLGTGATIPALTVTTVNGNTFTTGTYTLTGSSGKTLNFTNTLTLSGTDSTTMTFPSTSATIARTDAANTFTGVQTTTQVISTNNAIAASGNAATVSVTSKINTVTNNSAATLTITLSTAGAVNRQSVIVCVLDSSAVAQTITWVNTENSTVSAPTTSNGSTTLPLTVGFMYNTATSLWRCVASS